MVGSKPLKDISITDRIRTLQNLIIEFEAEDMKHSAREARDELASLVRMYGMQHEGMKA